MKTGLLKAYGAEVVITPTSVPPDSPESYNGVADRLAREVAKATGETLTAAIVVWLWAWSPVAVLLVLTCLYGAAGIYLYRQLTGLLRDWQTLSATLDQLRKDRACLEKNLA